MLEFRGFRKILQSRERSAREELETAQAKLDAYADLGQEFDTLRPPMMN